MEDIISNYNVNVKKYNGDNINLNAYTVYVINLKEDVLRRIYVNYILKKLNVKYNLVQVDRISKPLNIISNLSAPKFGCVISHLWCVKHAIENNCEKFIIFEDDVVFKKKINEHLSNMLNTEFDMLMLGALDFNSNSNLTTIEGNHYTPKLNVLGASANVYTLNFAKQLYNYKVNNCKIEEFDADFVEFYRDYKIKICYPNLVINEMSTTNLGHDFNLIKNSELSKMYDNMIKAQNININDYNFITIEFIEFCIKNIDKYKPSTITKKILVEEYVKYILSTVPKVNIYDLNAHKEYLLNSDYTINDIKELIYNYKKEVILSK